MVAAEYTRPLVPTARLPIERDGRKGEEEIVDEAVEKKPLRRPRVVVVDT